MYLMKHLFLLNNRPSSSLLIYNNQCMTYLCFGNDALIDCVHALGPYSRTSCRFTQIWSRNFAENMQLQFSANPYSGTTCVILQLHKSRAAFAEISQSLLWCYACFNACFREMTCARYIASSGTSINMTLNVCCCLLVYQN